MKRQEAVSAWDKNINSWISDVKQSEETMLNEQSKNWRGEKGERGVTVNGWESRILNFET